MTQLSQKNFQIFGALGYAIFFAFILGIAPVWADSMNNAGIANTLFPSTAPNMPLSEKYAGMIFGLFIGVMLTAAIYLFFIWIVIRDRSQVFLLLLLLCLGVNIATTNDLLMDQMGLQSQIMRNLLQSYSMILSYVFSIIFTYYFLEINIHVPILQIPLFLSGFLLLLLLGYSAFDQRLVHFALPTLGTLATGIILLSGTITLRRGVSGSLTHIIAFTSFLLGGLAPSLYDLGFIVDIEFANRLTYSAFAFAAIMFAIVIAGQFAKRQEEKERALEISNERFALAAKGSNEGLFDWNLRTSEVFFSDQFKKILGIAIENKPVSLKLWMRLVVKSDRTAVRNALRRFRQNPQTAAISIEYRIDAPDGSKQWLHTKAVATRATRTGKILRVVGSIGDITSRKQGEVALRASEVRFRSITEAHPVPVLIVALMNHQVLYASPGAEALLGLPVGTLTSHIMDRFLTKNSEREEILAEMEANHEVNLKEVTLTRGDGNALIAALSARRINYQNEAAMVLGLYDLTERKQAETQIAKQQEALQQSEKMAALGGLLAGVAHELNNPLSVVVGQATLLMEGSPEAKVAARADKIFKAADRCSRIVKSFLALARRKPPERKPINLNNIINSSLELITYQLRNDNIELNLSLSPTLPDISGDGDQLTQVFTNLALNAAQAMQTWQGKRQLFISSELQDSGDVLIKVVDTGPGIPAEIRTRVFEPFFTTKSTKGGTGVGLSLCLNIIETHGGKLLLEDTEGGGATFLITLPSIAATAQVKNEAGEMIGKLPNNLHLLLVDDEVELAQTLADLLEPEGCIITLAANGSIALEKIRQQPYDVIISDLRMPVMDGPTLYAELAKTMPIFLKRIIYVTGDTLSPHVQSFLSQTPVPVIEKPYRLQDVKHAILKLLQDNSRLKDYTNTDQTPPVA